MNVQTFKRLLADIKNIGTNRIKIKPGRETLEILKSLLSREDVRQRWKEIATISKVSSRRKNERKERRGPGSRKGTKYSRLSKKERWMIKVRALRKKIKELYYNGKIDSKLKKLLYLKVKGNVIKTKKALLEFVNEYLKYGGTNV